MPQPHNKTSKRGIGKCGTPSCAAPKALNHFLCDNCLPAIEQIKKQLDLESEDRSNFTRKTDNFGTKNSPKRPTCCWVGCFEPRYSGNNYCEYHLEMEEEAE